MRNERTTTGKSGRLVPSLERFDAVLFDLDGVVTDTARVHADAWTRMFDEFLLKRSREDGRSYAPFSPADYREYIDGRPRYEGIRAFLAARGIRVPEGDPSDGPEKETIFGLGARKNGLFLERIRTCGVDVYPSSVALIRRLRSCGVKTAVVTSSRNRAEILHVTGLETLFDATVDGHDRAALALRGKPEPDTFLEAARRLGVSPARAVVVEDALAGVAAGRAGDFGLVIGVDRAGHADALRAHGADLVFADLSELAPLPEGEGGEGDGAALEAPRLDPFWQNEPLDARRLAAAAEPDPWVLAYSDFDPAMEGRRETLFALGNGYFVTRGAAAESSADDVHYPGTYLAGGYNRLTTTISGREVEHEDLVNFPNWLPLTLRVEDGEWLDLRRLEILAFRQSLDLRRGLYERTVHVRDPHGRETRIVERRFVHMDEKHLAGQHVAVVAVNWSGRLTVRAFIDGGVVNAGVLRYRPFNGRHVAVRETASIDAETVLLDAETTQSEVRVTQAARLRVSINGEAYEGGRRTFAEATSIGQEIALDLSVGDRIDVEKIVALYSSRDLAISDPRTEARDAVARAGRFDDLLRSHALAWAQLWRRCDMSMDVEARSDLSNDAHLIVRLHIFHLLQTVSWHTMEVDSGVPARGWHGEGYRGHIFWDELFIFPFLSLRLPILTRSLLLYRHRRLPAARLAARAAGYRGAMFPWQSGSNGREETDVMFLNPRSGNWIEDHTHLQRHVGAAVAYNVWQYHQATADFQFLYIYGAELLFEIARFWASIAEWNEARGRYDIRGVMGPDEFHDRYPDRRTPGLDNNAYTNVMASWCIARALELFELLPAERCRELCERLCLEEEELERWNDVSRKLYLPFHEDGILSQFEGYEALEEFDWEAYREKYGNIMRLDLILEQEGDTPNRYKLSKQADVLMLFYLFSAEELAEIFARLGYAFDSATIPRTIDYYLRRTSNGSTLSGIVHAWVLARSCRRRSWTLFTEALRSDIDDIQGGTTPEGIHLGAMAGTVDLLQRCYVGLELRGDCLHFHPALPEGLDRLSFRLRYRKHSLDVEVTPTTLTVASNHASADSITIVVDQKTIRLPPGARERIPLAPPRTPEQLLTG